jgi:hypothetical protein
MLGVCSSTLRRWRLSCDVRSFSGAAEAPVNAEINRWRAVIPVERLFQSCVPPKVATDDLAVES